MTPQSNFMMLAPIVPARAAELRELLESMNHAPGRVNADNSLVPFGRFTTLHFARFVILDDLTTLRHRPSTICRLESIRSTSCSSAMSMAAKLLFSSG